MLHEHYQNAVNPAIWRRITQSIGQGGDDGAAGQSGQ